MDEQRIRAAFRNLPPGEFDVTPYAHGFTVYYDGSSDPYAFIHPQNRLAIEFSQKFGVGYITYINVPQTQRRQGLGSRLLTAAHTAITGPVIFADDVKNPHFLRRHGYRIQGTTGVLEREYP